MRRLDPYIACWFPATTKAIHGTITSDIQRIRRVGSARDGSTLSAEIEY
jgi:hypothetical protein